MVDNKAILELVDQGIKGDYASFQMVVRRLASKLKKDQPELAQELAKRLTDNGALRKAAPKMAIPVDADSRQKLLLEYDPVFLEQEPVWPDHIREELEHLIVERKQADKLISHGLVPTRSMIFEGDPGVGKTFAAKWIAKTLDLPLLILDLATVMSSFLGKTGSNIRTVLNYASGFPCVLLLDEFDAIAKRRDDDHDVGELKRLVTVLLQAIDDWPAESILIAATNHGELLDPAVWRRFDLNIHFGYPGIDEISDLLTSYDVDQSAVHAMAGYFLNMSYSDIEKTIMQIKKRSLLQHRSVIEIFIEEFAERMTDKDEHSLRDLKILKLHKENNSQREIQRQTGYSRPTIKKVITEANGG